MPNVLMLLNSPAIDPLHLNLEALTLLLMVGNYFKMMACWKGVDYTVLGGYSEMTRSMEISLYVCTFITQSEDKVDSP